MKGFYITQGLGSSELKLLEGKQQEGIVFIDEQDILKPYMESIIQDLGFTISIIPTKKDIEDCILGQDNTALQSNKLIQVNSCAYESSILYMVYRYHRLKNKAHEEQHIKSSLINYRM